LINLIIDFIGEPLFEKRGSPNPLPKTFNLKKIKTQDTLLKSCTRTMCGLLHAMAKTFNLKIIRTQGANLEFVQITVSLHQAKLGPPPFRQGRQILQYFSLYIDINSVQICVCYYYKKSEI